MTMAIELDLVFIIDSTGSMGMYKQSVQENIQNIIQDVITSERCLLNIGLIFYRDHPPYETSFVIKVENFTNDVEQVKIKLDSEYACGGLDDPEAMTPALHAAVHSLSWRKNSVKIAVLISDAPPHGLGMEGDSWPGGDPSGYDPIECVRLLAENGITLYTIGCEPAAIAYRDFFMALAFKTGGQYIPLENWLVDGVKLIRRIYQPMDNQGGTINIPALTDIAEKLARLTTLKEVREHWASAKGITLAPITTISHPPIYLGKVRRRPKKRLVRR